jgi:hypothetical protein
MRRMTFSLALLTFVLATFAWTGPVLGATPEPNGLCRSPDPPQWFHKALVGAIRISRDLPPEWAHSRNVARIVCWQQTNFDRKFRVRGGRYHVWHGIFAMTADEVETIAGPWMTRKRDPFELSIPCFLHGWDACPNRTENTRQVQQIIAGLRWTWLQYGTPRAAWQHIVETHRFNSYRRPGTDNVITRTPFRLCPVAGSVYYRDNFGERRDVGGYHPHWGNDVHAPSGRAVRAPFDGLAVGHSDGWFAGNYVTVVGKAGYVRNGHLVGFGKLGHVKAGTIIGYNGESGDASEPHDHFEWHPWRVPRPPHRAPSGYRHIMDAIDPYPFLNDVC